MMEMVVGNVMGEDFFCGERDIADDNEERDAEYEERSSCK